MYLYLVDYLDGIDIEIVTEVFRYQSIPKFDVKTVLETWEYKYCLYYITLLILFITDIKLSEAVLSALLVQKSMYSLQCKFQYSRKLAINIIRFIAKLKKSTLVCFRALTTLKTLGRALSWPHRVWCKVASPESCLSPGALTPKTVSSLLVTFYV